MGGDLGTGSDEVRREVENGEILHCSDGEAMRSGRSPSLYPMLLLRHVVPKSRQVHAVRAKWAAPYQVIEVTVGGDIVHRQQPANVFNHKGCN